MIILDRDRARERALDLCRFVDASPMPQLAAAECGRRLDAAGFTRLDEREPWTLAPGHGYYVVRAGTTVVAFRPGTRAPAETGVRAAAAHLDSPNLRVKHNADLEKDGYLQFAVDVYGGAILASWPDRDLGLSGRVLVRGADGAVETRLVRVDRPIARVTNLAIHLNRGVNDDGLKLDKQKHLPPLIGLAGSAAQEGPVLLGLLSRELSVSADAILDFDLGLHDLTPSTLGGLHEEFVFAPRLDNLGSSHAGLLALLAAHAAVSTPETTWMLALYDHEECGSTSAQGAQGTVFSDVLERLATTHPAATGATVEAVARTVARSFLVSADMAHAVHPNYADKHEPSHRPLLNRGPVIKRNDNQRYATDGETAALFRRLCADAGFAPQDYIHRSDLPCGTTIGPLTSSGVGIRTVDVGNPMLSMHSAREMSGTWDHDLMIEALRRLFV